MKNFWSIFNGFNTDTPLQIDGYQKICSHPGMRKAFHKILDDSREDGKKCVDFIIDGQETRYYT